MSTLRVRALNVKTTPQGIAIVTFEGGYSVRFVPNISDSGPAEHIQAIMLRRGGETIAVFYSPYQSHINLRPFGFQKKTTRGYTLERIIAYMQAAFDYAAKHTRRQPTAWSVISLAEREVGEITRGNFPLR